MCIYERERPIRRSITSTDEYTQASVAGDTVVVDDSAAAALVVAFWFSGAIIGVV